MIGPLSVVSESVGYNPFLWVLNDPFTGDTQDHWKTDIFTKIYNSSKFTVMKQQQK